MKKITFFKIFNLISICLLSIGISGQNTALNFDGTAGTSTSTRSGQSVYTTPVIPLTNSYTLMGWIKTNTANTNIFVWGSPTVNKYIQVQTRFDKKIRVYSAGGIISLDGTTTMDGNWHHIAVTNNAGTVTLYLDGTSENTTTADFSSITPTESSFGTGLFNNAYQSGFTGSIDEFSIWNVALNTTQIAAYKSAPPVGTETGLVAAYNFNPSGVTPSGDNTSLTTINDLTGNYPGTLFGFPLMGGSGNYVLSNNSTLGIKNIADIQIKLYPNPTYNLLHVSGIKNKADYVIYNVLGAEVLSNTITDNVIINIEDLKNGIYFLNIENSKTFRFVKK